MAPSISDIFGSPDLTDGSDAPFDPTALDTALDQVMRDRPPLGEPGGAPPAASLPDETATNSGEPPAVPAGEALPPPVESETQPPPPVVAPPAPTGEGGAPPVTAPVSTTPFDGMTDLELQELLAVRQAMQDPDRALAVRHAYLGVAPTAPAAAAPAPPPPPPAPTLPEHIDPDSFEATLWHENQDMKTRLAGLEASSQQNAAQTEQQLMVSAAKTATQTFAAKYGTQLTGEEMNVIVQRAAAQKLPEAFLATGASREDAMHQSLEFVLRSDDGLLGKVLGNPTPPPAPALPNGDGPASTARKRTLTALSSAASPSGEAPRPTPITHREDGRIEEGSRQSLIADLMNGMNREREGS